MRIKILTSILCVSILLLTAAGCGTKLSDSGNASPSGGSASPDSSQPVDIMTEVSILTGLVSAINDRSITLDLVAPSDSETGAASTSAETTGGDTGTIKVGSTVFDITGESLTVDLEDAAVIMLANRGYSSGTPEDISVGDLLAVAMNGETAAAVVDNGPSGLNNSPGGDDMPIDTPDTPTDPTDDTNTGEAAAYTVTTDNLNVRSSPSTTGSILGNLAKGTTVTGTVANGWLEFTYKNQTGYCNADYLTKTAATTGGETSAGIPDSGKSGAYIVTIDGLNIRTKPSTSGTALGKLSKGSIVLGTVKDGWLEFKYNNEIGYCSAQYLTEAVTSSGGGTGGVSDSSTAAAYIVVTDGLNVRSGPTTTDTVLGQLPKGTKVTGTVKDGWLKLSFNGRTGYCKATYISKA